jgi:hypothetical protein
MFMNKQRTFPSSEVPSEMEGRTDLEAISRDINSQVSDTAVEQPFKILNETMKSFPQFNATGRSLLIKFNSPGVAQEPTMYLNTYWNSSP